MNGFRGFSLASLAAVAALAQVGCGGSQGEGDAMRPILSDSPAAQAELRGLLARFERGARDERVALAPALLDFQRRHPGDELRRVADVHLAWIALEQGDLRRADAIAARHAAGWGAHVDVARVVRGAVLRRSGKPKAAFSALRPLVSKLVDPYVRAFLNEEITAAAMDSGAYAQAIALMSVWLREAEDEEREAVRARIGALLPEIPAEHLTRALRARRPKAEGDGAAEGEGVAPELDVRPLIADRLATVAREQGDAALARELLAQPDLLVGSRSDELAQIADTARVDPPTVGLLLSTRTPESRRRGVDIAAGVVHGLGLPGSGARLVSRDDGGAASVAEALGRLTGEGAAVLIAGSDREQATAAAAFARAHAIPVLLLHPPEPAALDGAFVFVVGEEPGRAGEILARALAERGKKPVAMVGGEDPEGAAPRGPDAATSGPHAADAALLGPQAATRVPAGAARASGERVALVKLSCDTTFDARAFQSWGIQGLVLNGDAPCAERALRAAPRGAAIALGLEAAIPPPPGSLVATAGLFPMSVPSVGALGSQRAAGVDPPSPEAQAALAAWLTSHPGPPSFWAALGRDAGVLAWAGVRSLPATGTEDSAEAKARRLAAANALATATTPLWTTSARGFGGGRVLPREIGAREIKKAR